MSSRVLSTVLLTASALIGGVAHAAPADLERVEITGYRPGEAVHTNVRQACPAVEHQLAESLARTHYLGRKEGVTTVSFRLSGGTVSEIHQRGGPYGYHNDIRRAVRRLDCQVAGADKLYVMRIAFINEGDPSQTDAPRRVALLD